MSKRQWGNGFNAGMKEGEKWGAIFAGGELELKLCNVNSRLMLIANALRLPVQYGSNRTDTWWRLYVSAAARQIEEIARELPGTLTGVYEFEKDIPQDDDVE